MTSIEKDLREKAEKIAHAANAVRLSCTDLQFKKFVFDELESLIPRIVAAVEQAGPCGKPYHLQANQYPYRVGQGGLGTYCTVCEAIEQAQADAIQSAADVCVKANQARGYAIAVAVAALTPRLVQLNAELQMKRSKLEGRREEAAFQLGAFHPRVSELERQITNLRDIERELEAERKGVQK